MATAPFDHLLRLSTPLGVYEHARGPVPRTEHGMCVDDVARALVVTAREPCPGPEVRSLAWTALRFLRAAQRDDGGMHNRRDDAGTWLDAPSTGDHWGRALWAFGVAASQPTDEALAGEARRGAEMALRARSVHPRAVAYAALGAAHLLTVAPEDLAAYALLLDARRALLPIRTDPSWPWPYGRLTYASAVVPEAMLAIGAALSDRELQRDGLTLLRWLVEQQTVGTHLSPVAVRGRSVGDVRRPEFDQQPIEVSALAEASAAAWDLTGDAGWTRVLARCVAWFEGDNDSCVPVRDSATGAGYDGLERGSVNLNQGAESTLAWLATAQVAEASRPAAVR